MADKIDKIDKIVELNIYEINKTTKFYTYTASWCPPCRKIKPFMIEKMREYKLVETKELPLAEFKAISQFVPFFCVHRSTPSLIKSTTERQKPTVQFKMCESIQSSNEHEMSVFLYNVGIGKIVLVDDF